MDADGIVDVSTAAATVHFIIGLFHEARVSLAPTIVIVEGSIIAYAVLIR